MMIASSYTLYLYLTICLTFYAKESHGDNTEYAPVDGFRNNLGQPTLGIAGSNFARVSPAAYSDGAYGMAGLDRPHPMEISLKVHAGRSGQASTFSRNAMQAYFAQLVLDEVALVTPGCPPEYENMPVPDQHPLGNLTKRPQVYQRSLYDQSTGYVSGSPRQQVNMASSFLDGGIIYGTSKTWTSLVRSYSGGKLLADTDNITSSFPTYNDVGLPLLNAPIPREHVMKPADRLFRLGNAKGHENPFLLALQVIWFRWHNTIAGDIAESSAGNLTDEQIFQTAKKMVVAHFQKILVTDWLPAFLYGNQMNATMEVLPAYTKYDSRQHAGVTQEFLAAMDFRHTFTPAAVWNLKAMCKLGNTTGRDNMGRSRQVKSLRLCNNFWDPQTAVKDDLEMILRGMLYTLGKREDGRFVSDFTEFFYGPFEYSRTDHVAAQIQRYRDHGLSGLNTIRRSYGLATLSNWTSLGGLNGTLHRLYGGTKPDNVDILTGGLLDQSGQMAGLSEIFRKILIDQFTILRDGDRFWYQRSGLFTANEIKEIESVTFKKILLATTRLSENEIPDNVFLCRDTNNCKCLTPPDVDNAASTDIDVCSNLATHDYIEGSKLSFALSFLALALVVPASYLVLFCLVKKRKTVIQEVQKRKSTFVSKRNQNKFMAREFLGKKSGFRDIKGEFKADEGMIIICDGGGKILRYINIKGEVENAPPINIHMSSDKDLSLLAIKVPEDIDLILDFVDQGARQLFIQSLERYLSAVGLNFETERMSESHLYSRCMDKDQRQNLLDKFFRAVCIQIFEGRDQPDLEGLGIQAIDDVRNIKLTITEFADAMGMQPSSLFVKNMFMLANKDRHQYISFKEFLDLFGIFLKGTAEEKGRLLFNIYDIHKTGHLTKDEFYRMIKSMLELAESPDLTDSAVNELVSSMFRYVGLNEGSLMSYEHFSKIFCADEYASTLQKSTIAGEAFKHVPKASKEKNRALKSKRASFMNSYRARRPLASNAMNGTPASKTAKTSGATKGTLAFRTANTTEAPTRAFSLKVSTHVMEYPGTKLGQHLHSISRFIDRYQLQIFWGVLYTLVTIGIFVERAYFFARGREHAGLRRLSGAWVTAMIRGSASVIMFTYSSLLVTMCRNTITALRETFLHRFVPFDSAVSFHKYIAVLAMIGTIVHVVTHGINLYCMCTQTTSSINCFFGEYYTASDSVATFHYWAFQTITGLAGVLVTALIFVMYVFASQFSRRHVFKAFWFTHSLYWLVYLLTFLHGVGRLVQAPLFSWYLIGPLLLFVIDRLQSISRNKVEIAVISGTPLPSGVLKLVFRRPTTFSYRSGQWVRIACPEMSESEYHPFTLTSAPHEPYLSLHIRAVGPWTTNLRKIYGRTQNTEEENIRLPNLYIDGPFGEGHQDWYNCEVAVLVGGGIGVTPFASILKDIAFRSKSGLELTCKKVYFIWVTRTQKSFEWLVDIIRQVEKADVREIVDTHIFVTQFQQNYDLRTTMLYICERHFQKVEGHSLFTGLKAVTHFGRPQFEDFFWAITQEHKGVSQVGVFSCGPGSMTSGVQKACSFMNNLVGPTFTHHFENF